MKIPESIFDISPTEHARLGTTPQDLNRSISNFVPEDASLQDSKQIDVELISFLQLRSRLSDEDDEESQIQKDCSKSIEVTQHSQ